MLELSRVNVHGLLPGPQFGDPCGGVARQLEGTAATGIDEEPDHSAPDLARHRPAPATAEVEAALGGGGHRDPGLAIGRQCEQLHLADPNLMLSGLSQVDRIVDFTVEAVGNTRWGFFAVLALTALVATSLWRSRLGISYEVWRRAHAEYPSHGDRFTGEPAYFKHVMGAAQSLMEALDRTPADYQYAIFHQPNAKFPQRVGKILGFTPEQIAPGLLSPRIGNTYAGSAVIGLTATLDVAEPGDRVLLVSYGSGAGSDAFSLWVTDRIVQARDQALTTEAYINRRTEIDYATYTRYRGKIKMS